MSNKGLYGLPRGQRSAASGSTTLRNLRLFSSTLPSPVNHCWVPSIGNIVTVGGNSNNYEFRSLATGNVVSSGTGYGFQSCCYVPSTKYVFMGVGSQVNVFDANGYLQGAYGTGQSGVYQFTYVPPLDEVWVTHNGYTSPNFSRHSNVGSYLGTYYYNSYNSPQGSCYVASNQTIVNVFYGSNRVMATNVASAGSIGLAAISSTASGPIGVCWAPSSNLIYVACNSAAYLYIYSAGLILQTSLPTPTAPCYLVYHEPTDRIYVTCQNGSILIINPNTNDIVGTISRASVNDKTNTVGLTFTGIASIPQTNQLVVSAQDSSYIAVFDAPRDARFMY